jgi:nicotinate-nucleotide pyrophosphorylase (carboxylating)
MSRLSVGLQIGKETKHLKDRRFAYTPPMLQDTTSVNTSINNALPAEIVGCIRRALEEDIGVGDATTNTIVPPSARLKGKIIAKQNGVVAGLDVARTVFLELDEDVTFNELVADGSEVENRTVIATVEGSARALLTGERTALNFLGRMSGIATLTREFVAAVAGTGVQILDTRKTAPGLRMLDKKAVRLGGGRNHRVGLFDMILIKDNHIDFAGSITAAVERARASATGLKIEVEARTLDDVNEALSLRVDTILLDNMTLETMKQAVTLVSGRARLEASGNVNLQNVSDIARTGVDYISVGALTHSPKVFDVSLEWAENVSTESGT